MELICEPYGCICSLETFIINGMQASYEDFGDKEDQAPDKAEEYGCGDIYKEICNQLEEKLSFGYCGWCI